MTKTSKDISEIPPMDDAGLERFWDAREPEDFQGWAEADQIFRVQPHGSYS